MDENKVTVTREEFIELIANEVSEMADKEGGLAIILTGGIITGIFCKKVFSDNDNVCISKEEYCELTAEAISEFVKDKDNKEVSIPVSLLAVAISGRIRIKLFSEERLEKERMLQVAKMLVDNNKEEN